MRMLFKKKIAFLLALNLLLTIIYGLTFFFDPERATRANAAYSWLDERFINIADRIEIYVQQERSPVLPFLIGTYVVPNP